MTATPATPATPAAPPPVRPVTVLYFAGSGRSGTTLINSILGSMPAVFAGGELRYVWQRGIAENHVCSCGEPFDRCPLWSAVLERTRESSSVAREDAAGVGSRLLRRLQVRQVPAMLARWKQGKPAVPAHADDEALLALYRSIAEATGASVVVDSSKLPPYGMLLAQMPEIDLRVLHVVRDSRATAFSWMREKKALDHGDDGALMPRQPVAKSSFLWLYWNTVTATRWGRAGRDRYLRIRYEDFVADPRAAMERICNLAGLDPAALPFASSHTVELVPSHIVAGNPNRHTRGAVPIKADSEWQRAMRPSDVRAVTALTAAGLTAFGYPLRVASGIPPRDAPTD